MTGGRRQGPSQLLYGAGLAPENKTKNEQATAQQMGPDQCKALSLFNDSYDIVEVMAQYIAKPN